MKRLVQGMRSLPSVKAPPDFLDQLHKRMERPSKISELWSRLFYPLRVKIPLQLAGAAVIALVLFSILPLQQSSLKLHSKTEQEKKAEDTAYYADESRGAGRAAAPVQKAVTPEPAKVTREVALNLKRQVRTKAATAEPSAAQAPASPAVQEMQRQKLAARAPAKEDKKEEALEKESESVLSINKAIEAAKGKALSVEYHRQTGRPEFVHAEIPAGQLPIFYAKLRELGDLQVSPETGTEKDSDTVQIKIRIVGQQ
jgi:flagellar biosynthesis GTPase FlhF